MISGGTVVYCLKFGRFHHIFWESIRWRENVEHEIVGHGSQPALTCSKLTKERLEHAVTYVLVSFLLTLNIFNTLP